ncbi:N-acetylmuramoyl-L-alanine amidase family protein [Pseudoxanthomonas winnipegensis]|uniref:N-acetylmuramoyl-L-alanine amidase family protein n=1 Tax=Pseudoxanthomonas winnipegensis TaxID=2480810 RepID=UPI003F8546F3
MRIVRALRLPFLLVASLSFPSLAAQDQEQIPHASGTLIKDVDPIQRKRIEELLDQTLAEAAAHMTLIDGQTSFDIKTKLIPGRHVVIIDLGTHATPARAGAEWEDQQHELAMIAVDLLRGLVSVDGAEFTFGGYGIHQLRPDPPVSFAPPRSSSRATALATSTKVALAGGHGLYFNYQYNDWRAQRDPSNSVTEDFITPYFARDLATELSARGATIYKARTNGSTTHTPSGQPWWKVSARYYLQSILPEQTSIWHSLPNATDSLRERDEDIRSRPLYANYVGADYAVHLHTNGSSDASVRGTRGYYQPGRTADAKLTAQILCSMKQTIRSVSGYETWSVVETPTPEDKGENRLANMPSTIIELAFHTNADDAAALGNSLFRSAAVKGIERGISDYHDGTDCVDFRITNIPSFSGPVNTDMDMLIYYDGNPRYPVTLRTRNISCAQGWSCPSVTKTFSEKQTSPLKRTFRCTGSSDRAGTFTYAASLTDASGIKTTEVEYTYSCTAGS